MSIIDSFTNVRKVLIANRGEIACRIIKSCRQLGLVSVAIYSQADRSSLHVKEADEAYLLPGKRISMGMRCWKSRRGLGQMRSSRDTVSFLSENAEFAEQVEQTGLVWVGPSANVIRQFGLKHTARELAIAAGVPVVQGTGLLPSAEDALQAAERIGYPIMLKATAGGGGMGLQICEGPSEIRSAFQSVLDRGSSLFKNSSMFMEKYIAKSRHVEVQVFGNGQGGAVHFNERECSVQRRHQKVVEECPSPFVERTPGLRERMTSCAVSLVKSVNYGSAGTVDTRLQVEHGITEQTHSVDLVSLMLEQAEMQARSSTGGLDIEALARLQKTAPEGYAIEARVYAEIPSRNFAPSPGLLQKVEWYSAPGVRVDTWVTSGTNISPFYDPMIAKVIVYDGQSHDNAVEKMMAALTKSKVQGCPTNIHYLAAIVDSNAFRKGDTTTAFLSSEAFHFTPCTIDVISAGTYTTVQDWPARLGVGNGIPEAGPMDSLSFRLANIIAGNREGMEGLEVTLQGPELKFNVASIVAVTGAAIDVSIDGKPADMRPRVVEATSPSEAACRRSPEYLGSKSTTSTLGLGGYQGRQLAPNDSLDLDPRSSEWASQYGPASVPEHLRLDKFFVKDWTLYVMPGPHDEPEFVTDNDRKILYETRWQISHNATRSGYRLRGPRLDWAPVTEFKESGSHGSNIIDEPYVLGSLNFNGDDAVLLPLDAPMAGGLATTTTVCRADLWRMGQCRPGDSILFKRVSWESALAVRQRTEKFIEQIQGAVSGKIDASQVEPLDISVGEEWNETILHEIPADEQKGTVQVKFRQFDPLRITQKQLLQKLVELEETVGGTHEPLPSRIFKFPILLDDPISKAAVADYAATVRDSAVYLPSNMEYIAKANAVKDAETAAKSFVACPQLVVEVSFLAGTPLLLPLDPRLIYVAQKYNPVRAFTPEGTVGLGGPLLVIYPMASPGGYQFCGRSLAAWDAYAVKPGFVKPWLLKDFDQVQFYEVDQAGFDKCYEDFKTGRFEFEVEETMFDPAAHQKFLDSIRDETEKFMVERNAAGKAEGERENGLLQEWRDRKTAEAAEDMGALSVDDGAVLLDLVSPMTASLWKVLVSVGEAVKAGQTLAILEAMKMEIPVRADEDMDGCLVARIQGKTGGLFEPGQTIMSLKA
ncbi:hypothetical protein QFC20_004924 [Naganishia adeliensis]|uniref:Uncharacterized protein n=1 Tax=Naganishia adeliensis TaxID=92952 RepID=A0ACC2VU06_9TREE|nr:hypothetical protein QFC20_004924 [Naganishia adeliensis]